MTILGKSKNNMRAAELMVNNGFFAPSVHSSYYGSFLLVKHILYHCLSIDYNTQKLNANGKDSHKYVMECLKNDLSSISAKDEKKFLMNFNALKKNRRKADYLDNPIDKVFAERCFKDSCDLREEIANIYKITL